MLPQPHRAALAPLAVRRSPQSVGGILLSALSILLGAWTHIFWDAFTHRTGWFVQHSPFLQGTAFRAGTSTFTVSYLLQQLSTIAGGLVLFLVYLRWLGRHSPRERETGRWRYLWIPVTLTGSISLACLPASFLASRFSGFLAVRVFLFQTCVYTIRIFVPLLIVSAAVAFAFRDKTAADP